MGTSIVVGWIGIVEVSIASWINFVKILITLWSVFGVVNIYSNIHVSLVLMFSFADFESSFMFVALCGVRLDGLLTWFALFIMRFLVWDGLKIGLELRNIVIMLYKPHLKFFEKLKEVLFAMFMVRYFLLCAVPAM